MKILALSVLVGVQMLNTVTADAESIATLSATDNLLSNTDFFVCGSEISGMNGHYIISDEYQSDVSTPVFIREDQDGEDVNSHDFRLYRHNGFWMFADVAAWPPKTYFRCDPTKPDALEACGPFRDSPPRHGYTAVDSSHPVQRLELMDGGCTKSEPLNTPRAEL